MNDELIGETLSTALYGIWDQTNNCWWCSDMGGRIFVAQSWNHAKAQYHSIAWHRRMARVLDCPYQVCEIGEDGLPVDKGET